MKCPPTDFQIGEIVKVSRLCAITKNEEGIPIPPIEYFDRDTGDKHRVISEALFMKSNSKLLNAVPFYEVEKLEGRGKGKKRVYCHTRLHRLPEPTQMEMIL